MENDDIMNTIEREMAAIRRRLDDSIVERNELRLQMQALRMDLESNAKTKKDTNITKKKTKIQSKANAQSTLFLSDNDESIPAISPIISEVIPEMSTSEVFRLTSDFTGVAEPEPDNDEVQTIKRVKNLFDWCLSPAWSKCLKELNVP